MDSNPLIKARKLVSEVQGGCLSEDERLTRAVALARCLLEAAAVEQTAAEREQQHLLARMMEDPKGKLFTTQLTDQCFRSHDVSRIADQLSYLMRVWGVPSYLLPWQKALFWASRGLALWLPRWCIPAVQSAIRRQVSHVVVAAESPQLTKYLQNRYESGVSVNLNYLGEAILGDEEAERRLQAYLAALARPDVAYISVKISTLSSQLSLLAFEATLERLALPLRRLYTAAQQHTFRYPDGRVEPKFVNLDMEEYRDLELTVRLFQKVLSEPAYHTYAAGIVLQSYLPDAFRWQEELAVWAQERCRQGGAPVKIRLVKGANLAMERVEASLRGWSPAPYGTKWESDANFKRMLHFGCEPTVAVAVHLGVGSHNLLDIAYTLVLRAERRLEREIRFEMLEGMAPHLQRVVHQVAGDILVYSPAAEQSQFHTAVAYLMRRLDENTAAGNFLRVFFGLHADDEEWRHQVEQFSVSIDRCHDLDAQPRRHQNRSAEKLQGVALEALFSNEPDTDWSLPANRGWIAPYLHSRQQAPSEDIPLVIGGERVMGEAAAEGFDPSRPGHRLYRYQLGTAEQAAAAVATASQEQTLWGQVAVADRSHCLAAVAATLRARRGDLIAAMVADGGKTVLEADTELSEAIDFCEYYRRSVEEITSLQDITWQPRGVTLVAPPWNFPCSLAVGGIAAALAAGNVVIYKPPPETVLVGWLVAQAFWHSGVSERTLQFITGDDDTVGTTLVQHPGVAVVVLTGATETARHLLRLRPGLTLLAETGGKNSLIITSLSDRDQAIRALLQSAFGHAGQKCSACSLAICLPEVYEDPHFRQQLRDAAASLPVGSAWDSTTAVPPLVRAPAGALADALAELAPGEEWLLKPEPSPDNPQLWSPGIILGVTSASPTYQKELFGPVLALMRAEDLEQAVELANGTPYGLTAGLHSLDRREHYYWLRHIQAGNCYINRTITGAIVQRQPFGGCKASSFGPGAKAGGPNYVAQLMCAEAKGLPQQHMAPSAAVSPLDTYVQQYHDLTTDELALWRASIGSYAFFWQRYFSQDHDPSRILGEDNILRYHPRSVAIVRLQPGDSQLDVLRLVAAALTVHCPLQISAADVVLAQPMLHGSWRRQAAAVHFTSETLQDLVARLPTNTVTGVRFLQAPSTEDATILASHGYACLHQPVSANGRLELLHYLREVTISYSYHRYGYLGNREKECHPGSDVIAGCCFGPAAPEGCCGKGECDQI